MLSLTEILGTVEDGATEICATASAEYNFSAEKVTVVLEAFARKSDPSRDGQHLPEPWLPKSERVTEHLPREEADAFAHDVFQSWVKRVRASVPAELQLRT